MATAPPTPTRRTSSPTPPRRLTRSALLSGLGSLVFHGIALAALTYVVVGVLQAEEQAPPRLAVSQQRGPGASEPLVRWAQPPQVEVAEPLTPPPEVPPLELADPAPSAILPGSGAPPARYRAADAVRPRRPAPATPSAASAQPPTAATTQAKPTAKGDPRAPQVRERARVRTRSVPQRPKRCRRRGHTGSVRIKLYVGLDGLPYHPKVVRSAGCSRLDEAALAAVREYRFHPATEGGRPVTSTEWIVIHFVRP